MKDKRKEEEGRDFRSDDVSLPKQPFLAVNTGFLGMTGPLPGDWKQWMNSLFTLLEHNKAFALPTKLSLSQH